MLLHVLFEHAAGYALFAVKEVEEIGMLLPQVCILRKFKWKYVFVHTNNVEKGLKIWACNQKVVGSNPSHKSTIEK